MQSIILHLDMNSYFASVEQQDNPAWRGKVLGVCEHLGGIIIAASIEAKRWGIKTGTPVWEARKLYPGIVLTHTRAEAYRHYHRAFLKVLRDYSNFVEPASIDEAYADITKICNISNGKIKNQKSKFAIQSNTFNLKPNPYEEAGRADYLFANPFEEAVKIALEIKQRMKKEVGDYMTCSIGIAENKLLAKIASDLKKPDGIVVIQNSNIKNKNDNLKIKNVLALDIEELYQRLKLTDIPGIARRQEKRLNEIGIKTLRDLRDCPLHRLVRAFGQVSGWHLHHMGKLQGSWKPSVFHDETIKSIGHMYTLPKEFRKKEFFEPVLYKLCEMVGERLRRKKLMGFGISVFVGDKQYNNFGNSEKVDEALYGGHEIFLQARRILYAHPGIEDVLIEAKIIGVTVFNLQIFYKQQSLFKKPGQKAELNQALDKVNAKYGKFAITYAPVLKAGKVFRDSVGFGRVKEV